MATSILFVVVFVVLGLALLGALIYLFAVLLARTSNPAPLPPDLRRADQGEPPLQDPGSMAG